MCVNGKKRIGSIEEREEIKNKDPAQHVVERLLRTLDFFHLLCVFSCLLLLGTIIFFPHLVKISSSVYIRYFRTTTKVLDFR